MNKEAWDLQRVEHKAVEKILCALKINKAAGLDKIPARLLRDAGKELVPSISYLVNKSLTDGKVPALWKMARVAPLYKNDDKLQVQNYRPISVLPAISKVIERVVHTQLSLHLDQLGYMYKHQYGFRRGRSTQQAIAQINNWVLESMDSGEVTGLLFLDISKAFDSLNHKVLLGKLESIGLSSKSVSWFRSYLVGRRQCVLINGELSDYCAITHGVPQGSILGPLLFNIYINSLSNSVEKARVILYADDAVLSCTASTAVELQAILARELNHICEWYSANRLTINAKKTQLMLAGSKTKLSSFDDVELQMNNAKVERVQSCKYLGITMDAQWTWRPHISNLIKKLGHRLSVFNRIRRMLDYKTRIAYYNGLVLPHFDYGDIVWGDQPGLKSDMDRLQAFQKRFAKRIMGNKMSSSEALEHLKWIPLAGRRFGHRCCAVQNAIKGDIPEHFNIFKTTMKYSHGYSTRNSYLPKLPKIRTDWGKRITSYKCTIDWSSLPDVLKRPMPCDIFKQKIRNFLTAKYF